MKKNFYRAFEDRYRGSRELITGRLQFYRPFIEPFVKEFGRVPAIDLGCGRGEWLEVMLSAGFDARGIDLDEGMLQSCVDLGLPAEKGEAIAHLRALPSKSQAIVSAFHVVEHIPFDALEELVSEAKRVLLPGGLLILETPNPENIMVATCSFYLDPTHQRPIPPNLLSFVAEHAGFERVKVIRLQESMELATKPDLSLEDILGGVSPDYSVVAQKRGKKTTMDGVNKVFSQDYGLTFSALSGAFNAQMKVKLKEESLKTSGYQLEEEKKRSQDAFSQKEALQSRVDLFLRDISSKDKELMPSQQKYSENQQNYIDDEFALENFSLRKKIGSLKQELAAKEEILFETRQENSAKCSSLEARLLKLDVEKSTLDARLSALLAERETLATSNSSLSTERVALTGRVEEVACEAAVARAQSESLRQELALARETMEKERSSFEARQRTFESEREELKQELAEKEEVLALARETMEKERSSFEARQRTFESEREELKQELAEKEEVLALARETMEKERSSFEARQRTFESEREELKQNLANCIRDLEKAGKALTETESELINRIDELHNIHQDNHRHWQLAESLKQDLAAKEQAWSEERSTLASRLSALLAERDTLATSHSLLVTEREALLANTCWRITAPIRWIRQGVRIPWPTPSEPLDDFFIKHAALYIRRRPHLKERALQFLFRNPKWHARVLPVLQGLNGSGTTHIVHQPVTPLLTQTDDFLQIAPPISESSSSPFPVPVAPPPIDFSSLTPQAQRIYTDLNKAIEMKKSKKGA